MESPVSRRARRAVEPGSQGAGDRELESHRAIEPESWKAIWPVGWRAEAQETTGQELIKGVNGRG